MPLLTDVQNYAAQVMRTLLCVRRDQIHWMIGRKYPSISPEKVMRQLVHILPLYDDGAYYRWSGTDPNPDRVAAVDVMLMICRGTLPIIGGVFRLPCALLFFVPAQNTGTVLPYRVYVPKEGAESTCRTVAEIQQNPKGHAAVFVISDKSQIPLLRVSHLHIFALRGQHGGYELLKAAD